MIAHFGSPGRVAIPRKLPVGINIDRDVSLLGKPKFSAAIQDDEKKQR